MTQEQLAEAAGLHRNQVQNIENSRNNARDSQGRPTPGPGNPQLDTIWAIARALEIYVVDLLPHQLRGATREE
jgi:transcriptional regulator with XRE-family HTH domain